MKRLLALFVAAFMLTAPALAHAQDKLVIWWNKSFVPPQDEAMKDIVARWEKQSGKSADLSFFSLEDHPKRVIAAFEAGNVPDVDFGQIVGVQVGNFAFEDKLLEISDIVGPLNKDFTDGAIRATDFLNGTTGKRGIYAFPIMQHGVNLHYWADMLQSAGYSDKDIPTEWGKFWPFWGEVQKKLREKPCRKWANSCQVSVASVE